ncbi:hypothetical protein Brsp07_04513 [Brucella sp. NBRC 14130]
MEIETLGDAYTHSVTVRMWCAWGPYTKGYQRGRECNYSKVLDMETLLCTRGRGFPLARLKERLRCPRCGSREVRIFWDFPTEAHSGRAHVARS